MALSLPEQEVHINFNRNEDCAQMYCTDVTWITKMDKLVAKSPEFYEVVAETENGKTYRFPKRLISLRSSVVRREYTNEQKQQMAERLKLARERKGI